MRRVLAIVIALAAIIAIVLYVMREDAEAPAKPAPRSAKLPEVRPAQQQHRDDIPPALPPPDYKPAERPEQKLMTQEQFVERRTKGLALLDETILRVQKEHADAVAAKDTDRASFTKVRLDRLAAVREQRVEELEQAKRGELKPDPDALPAGRRPSGEP
jgi:hypothetical protein